MNHDSVAEVTLEPSGLFGSEFRERLVDEFGSDGAWLALSGLSYGWRTHYDLACGLATGSTPLSADDDSPQHDLGIEYQIVRDLQIQAMLFSAAEQFATLIRAARRHSRADEAFFDAYVGAPVQLATLVDDIADLDRQQLIEIVGDPATSVDGYIRGAVPGEGGYHKVAGMFLPAETVRREMRDLWATKATALVESIVANVSELSQFVEAAPTVERVDMSARPLRDVDNAFRHGLRVLLHQCLPEARRFRVGSMAEPLSNYSVDLYMPQRSGPERIRYASVSCPPSRTEEHLVSLRELCTRTGQLIRGFIGKQLFGDGRWLLSATELRLPDPPSLG